MALNKLFIKNVDIFLKNKYFHFVQDRVLSIIAFITCAEQDQYFNRMKMKYKSSIGLILVGILLGSLFTFLFIYTVNQKSRAISSYLEHREAGYQFINPLLECEQVNSLGNAELKPLQKKLEAIVSQHQDISVGIYYRDLTNGPWFGINEDQPFSPQSLLKLPVALAFFKLAENDAAILDETIVYDEEIANKNVDVNLELNQAYPIHQLIFRMLTISDNVAFNLLTEKLPEKFIRKVHQDLNISYPDESTPDDFISVKSYASIFRVLYNSSYLSRKYSELMLEYLAEGSFTDGLVAGVPADILVAHKFGVLNSQNSEYASQLHDCGIVYLPEKPYLLCVMTKGNDQQELIGLIQEISAEIYQYISQQE